MNPEGDPSKIKVLVPHVCPHCQKDVVLEIVTVAPSSHNIYNPADLASTKDRLTKAVMLENYRNGFPEEFINEIIEWLAEDEVIITPDEYEGVWANILVQGKERALQKGYDIKKTSD